MKLFAAFSIAATMLAGTSSAYRIQMFDGADGSTRIHDAGGSGDLSCWDLTGTSANNKASYVSWSTGAGERCTIFFYDDRRCSTYLVQYTASFNSALPNQYNNKITSYRIDC